MTECQTINKGIRTLKIKGWYKLILQNLSESSCRCIKQDHEIHTIQHLFLKYFN